MENSPEELQIPLHSFQSGNSHLKGNCEHIKLLFAGTEDMGPVCPVWYVRGGFPAQRCPQHGELSVA